MAQNELGNFPAYCAGNCRRDNFFLSASSLPPRPKGLFCGGIENNRGREILSLSRCRNNRIERISVSFFFPARSNGQFPLFFSPRPSRLPDFFPPFLFRFGFFFAFLGENGETKGHFSKLPRMRERGVSAGGETENQQASGTILEGKNFLCIVVRAGGSLFPERFFFEHECFRAAAALVSPPPSFMNWKDSNFPHFLDEFVMKAEGGEKRKGGDGF